MEKVLIHLMNLEVLFGKKLLMIQHLVSNLIEIILR